MAATASVLNKHYVNVIWIEMIQDFEQIVPKSSSIIHVQAMMHVYTWSPFCRTVTSSQSLKQNPRLQRTQHSET